MNIKDLFDHLISLPPTPSSRQIKVSVAAIKKICDQEYYDRLFYGNSALNRKILLDSRIAKLLTSEVILYLLTNPPTDIEKTIRTSGEPVALKDVLYHGLTEGLRFIKYLPNNDKVHGPAMHQFQKTNYQENTRRIIHNIQKMLPAGQTLDTDDVLSLRDLKGALERIIHTVNILAASERLDELLSVPRYTKEQIQGQMLSGFNHLCQILQLDFEVDIYTIHAETLEGVCEKFLKNPKAILDGDVSHLFYDRVHLEAAIASTKAIIIGDHAYTFRDIFRCMVDKIILYPEEYAVEAVEQLNIRLDLVLQDLDKRYPIIQGQAIELMTTPMFIDITATFHDALQKKDWVNLYNVLIVDPAISTECLLTARKEALLAAESGVFHQLDRLLARIKASDPYTQVIPDNLWQNELIFNYQLTVFQRQLMEEPDIESSIAVLESLPDKILDDLHKECSALVIFLSHPVCSEPIFLQLMRVLKLSNSSIYLISILCGKPNIALDLFKDPKDWVQLSTMEKTLAFESALKQGNIAILDQLIQREPEQTQERLRETINVESMMNSFIQMMYQLPHRTLSILLKEACKNEHWPIIGIILDMPDKFISVAEHQKIIVLITNAIQRAQFENNWDLLFKIQRVFARDYSPTAGPLQKNIYTHQLEHIFRLLLSGYRCEIVQRPRDTPTFSPIRSYLIELFHTFKTPYTYDLSAILQYANWEHIELNQEDYELYTQYMAEEEMFSHQHDWIDADGREISFLVESSLDPREASNYQDKLYQYANTHALPIPEKAITFEEMQAINIYTSRFYSEINGFLRGTLPFRMRCFSHMKEVIVQSVMCASGLTKIPATSFDMDAYRGVFVSTQELINYISVASQQTVVPLAGFISTSLEQPMIEPFLTIHPHSSKEFHPTQLHFQHLKGCYVQPISANAYEDEFLMPPTQIQLIDYQYVNERHYFEAVTVSDLSKMSANTMITQRLFDECSALCALITKQNAELFDHPMEYISISDYEYWMTTSSDILTHIKNKLMTVLSEQDCLLLIKTQVAPLQFGKKDHIFETFIQAKKEKIAAQQEIPLIKAELMELIQNQSITHVKQAITLLKQHAGTLSFDRKKTVRLIEKAMCRLPIHERMNLFHSEHPDALFIREQLHRERAFFLKYQQKMKGVGVAVVGSVTQLGFFTQVEDKPSESAADEASLAPHQQSGKPSKLP